MSLSESGFERKTKRTRKREFPDEMNLVVPWAELMSPIAPHAPSLAQRADARRLRQPPCCASVSSSSGPTCPTPPRHGRGSVRQPHVLRICKVDVGEDHLPDESTILRFRHVLEAQSLSIQILATVNATLTSKGLLLKQGTVFDATLIAAPSSTKNNSSERDPEMHQTKKGNQWHFGMKAHAGVDADSALVHTVTATAANAHDITLVSELLHGQETDVFADSGYRGVEKREEVQAKHPDVNWHIAMMPGKRMALKRGTPIGAIL